MDSISASTSVAQGASFNFSYVIKNSGQASAGGNYSAIYLDGQTDSHWLPGTTAYWDWFTGIGANSSAAMSTADSFGTAGLSVGQHTLWIKADGWGYVSESDESNNWRSFTFDVTAPPRPDLAVESISAPTSVGQGDNFDFSYVVKNSGQASAGGNYSAIYLDGQTSSHWLPGDRLLGLVHRDRRQQLG